MAKYTRRKRSSRRRQSLKRIRGGQFPRRPNPFNRFRPVIGGPPPPLTYPSAANPSAQLSLQFPSGRMIAPGSTPLVPQDAVKDQPKLSGTPVTTPGLKTLIFWDANGPAGTFLHWLIVNMPGADINQISKGNTLVPWAPPTPAKGTGEHLYSLAVFQQGAPIQPGAPQRSGFSVESFAKANNLQPLAITSFKVAAP